MGPIEQSLRDRAVAARLRLFKSSRIERPVPLLVTPMPEPIEELPPAEPRPAKPRPSTAKGIILEVCEKHGITYAELLSKSRRPHVVLCRKECCYVLRHSDIRVLGKRMSLPAIGRHLGGLDHTTVLYSIRKFAELCTNETDLETRVSRVALTTGEVA